jgi:hypothetical protein
VESADGFFLLCRNALQKSFISAEGQALAHFLIVTYHIRIPANYRSVDLRIDPYELDTAVWLSAEMLRAIWRKEPGSRLAQTSAGDVVEFAYSQMHEIDPPGSGERTAECACEAFTALIG